MNKEIGALQEQQSEKVLNIFERFFQRYYVLK